MDPTNTPLPSALPQWAQPLPPQQPQAGYPPLTLGVTDPSHPLYQPPVQPFVDQGPPTQPQFYQPTPGQMSQPQYPAQPAPMQAMPIMNSAMPAMPMQPLAVNDPSPVPSPVQLDPKTQILERLKGSVNVLVTVSPNPSVDQLAAAIGFTLVLNKLKKHGTAVFSGETPSTIEFLQPEKNIEKNTDTLQDFIVSLDKAKADKLRYKIEDKYVKIFITPYHTALSKGDLEFGHGDLNVDVIVALGVGKKDQLDQAIVAHGRILHDATIISITKEPGDDIGTINWHVPQASSFSEILVGLSDSMKSEGSELFDEQIATAFLTGIVAETDRFSNERTTPQTMTTSAVLMRAGANQQLIATHLDEPEPIPETKPVPVAEDATLPLVGPNIYRPMPAAIVPTANPAADEVPAPSVDGELTIHHSGIPDSTMSKGDNMVSEFDDIEEEQQLSEIDIDNDGIMRTKEDTQPANQPIPPESPKEEELPEETPLAPQSEDQPANEEPVPIEEPGVLPTIVVPETPAPTVDMLAAGRGSIAPPKVTRFAPQPQPRNLVDTQTEVDNSDQTLEQIEQAVHSPHLANTFTSTPTPPPVATPQQADNSGPIQALNAMLMDIDTGNDDSTSSDAGSPPPVPPPYTPQPV